MVQKNIISAEHKFKQLKNMLTIERKEIMEEKKTEENHKTFEVAFSELVNTYLKANTPIGPIIYTVDTMHHSLLQAQYEMQRMAVLKEQQNNRIINK
jgi:effector-binding domain-containing protein